MHTQRTQHTLFRTSLLHALSLAAVRFAGTAALWALGFDALSDDDFARVTLSQAFAQHPTLDPTGTSWLPFPFWITGTAMLVFGTSIATAKNTALLLACASEVLLYSVACISGIPARTAWAGVLLWTLVPVGLFCGAAAVPEIPTAALCASAILLLRRSNAKSSWLAAGLILPATLSRYEAWPVAACVATTTVIAGIRDKSILGMLSARRFAARAGATALACAGPIAWIIWNHHAHGNALHFHTRVSAYWFAWAGLHGGRDDGRVDSLLTNIAGFVEPPLADGAVLVLVCGAAAFWSRAGCRRDHRLREWITPIAACICTTAALLLAQLSGGAPTHHPERALLAVWAVGWIVAADLLDLLTRQPELLARGWRRRRTVLLATAATYMIVGVYELADLYGVDRSDALRVGTWLLDQNHIHTSNLLLAPEDYSYFAILAARQSSELVTLVSSVDPRDQRRLFEGEESLRIRASCERHCWLVAQGEKKVLARRLGAVRYSAGQWVVVEVDDESARAGSGRDITGWR